MAELYRNQNRVPTRASSSRRAFLLAVLVLALGYWLMVSSALRKSATVDEQSHLFRGVAYVQAEATHFLLGHPLLGSILSALPLLTEKELNLPVDGPAWQEGNWSVAGDQFLWQVNPAPQRLLFLGRLPVIWMTLLLASLVYRWGLEWAGPGAGLAGLLLLLLDPNLLAHGRFITGDLPLTLLFTLTLFAFWKWSGRPLRLWLLLTGIGLGLALSTKFNGLLLLPVLGLLALFLARQRRRLKPLLVLLPVGLIGLTAIWAVYRFRFWQGFLPGGAFWDDLLWQLQYVGGAHGTFLFGEVSTTGWWYYFPVVFLLKTPLPTLLLLGWAGLHWFRRERSFSAAAWLLFPAALYGAASVISALNIGYRYLIPVLPFLYLFIAVTLRPTLFKLTRPSALVALLLLLLGTRTLVAWPDYVPFFNLFATGQGWRLVSDSNVDWGQDLPALAAWQQETGERVYLSYFGTAHPSAYGIEFDPLPTWAAGPEQGNPDYQSFNPADPAPGVYAISVTNLQGVVLGADRDLYQWFRRRQPEQKLGGSLFLYRVEPRGPATNLVLAGLRPALLAPALHDHLGTNDVSPRWFDPATSFIWPGGGGWLAAPIGIQPPETLTAFWPEQPAVEVDEQILYRLPPPPALTWQNSETAQSADNSLKLLGYQRLEAGDEQVALLTAWQVVSPSERPLKLFVHALDADEQIVGQWDGLDVPAYSWRAGDVFIQFHSFDIRAPVAVVNLATGAYDGATLERVTEYLLLESR